MTPLALPFAVAALFGAEPVARPLPKKRKRPPQYPTFKRAKVKAARKASHRNRT